MQDQLIEFNTAKLAKEKGFNVHCKNIYDVAGQLWINEDFPYNSANDSLFAPTQSLLQRWLREVHQLSVCVDFRKTKTFKVRGINSVYYDVMIYRLSGGDAYKLHKMNEISDNYETALEKGLFEALSLIK